MIRTEKEYTQTVNQLAEFEKRTKEKLSALKEMDLSAEQIERVIEPDIVFSDQLKEEVLSYERLCRGDEKELKKFCKFNDIGKQLIALRIFRGLSQRELAARLGVDPSQVSRDEKNEYNSITLNRIKKILEALDTIIIPDYELAPPRPREPVPTR